jgi:predicted metal-dependent hydrolase
MPGKRKPPQLELPLDFKRTIDVSPATILLNGRIVSYTVRRSRRRRGSFTLAVDDRGLRIGVPWTATQRWIDDVLRKHHRWILRKLEQWQDRRPPPLTWADGATLMMLGAPLTLACGTQARVPAVKEGRLLIGVPRASPPALIARMVTAWLREQAMSCFGARVAHYAPHLSVVPGDLRLSNARTRWGSCHPSGRILLNWRLIQMPLRLVDYVVVHELAHLREMNHSRRFWRTVAGVLPDYALRRKEMHAEGHRYLVV